MADHDNDERLQRAKKLIEQAGGAGRDSSTNHESAYDKIIAESTFFRWLSAIAQTLRAYLGPVGTFLAWLIRLFGRWLLWLCIRPRKEDDAGNVQEAGFSIPRLLRNSVLSVLALFLLQVTLKGLYYYGTYFEETVYVTGKQEILTGELYQFGGCTSLPCSTASDNGKFYLIESSLYFPIMFYPEENVFANVPQQDAACHVEGYGIYFRTLRWIYKSLQLYQHVVDVSCRPYTDLEIRQAVDDGHIVRDQ